VVQGDCIERVIEKKKKKKVKRKKKQLKDDDETRHMTAQFITATKIPILRHERTLLRF
jgi:hypothetical protein